MPRPYSPNETSLNTNMRRVFSAFTAVTLVSTAGAQGTAPADSTDPVGELVSRLDLEKYKATIKGLTQFGDRRQGTTRNRDAVDWIEAQLKSYGCTNTERITYNYQPVTRADSATRADSVTRERRRNPNLAQGGGRIRGIRMRTGVNNDSLAQRDAKLRALNSEPSTPGTSGGLLGSRGFKSRRPRHLFQNEPVLRWQRQPADDSIPLSCG